jgi:hypothetical protein
MLVWLTPRAAGLIALLKAFAIVFHCGEASSLAPRSAGSSGRRSERRGARPIPKAIPSDPICPSARAIGRIRGSCRSSLGAAGPLNQCGQVSPARQGGPRLGRPPNQHVRDPRSGAAQGAGTLVPRTPSGSRCERRPDLRYQTWEPPAPEPAPEPEPPEPEPTPTDD